MVAVEGRGGLLRRGVGAGAGLGEGEGAVDLAGVQFREIFLFLLLGPKLLYGIRGQHLHGHYDAECGVGVRDLFDQCGVEQFVFTLAAVRPVRRVAQEARLPHRFENIFRELGRPPVELLAHGVDVLLGKGASLFAYLFLRRVPVPGHLLSSSTLHFARDFFKEPRRSFVGRKTSLLDLGR